MIYQSNVGINDPQDESVAQQQAEATAENNAGSNHSSGHMACIQRNAKQIEKGSDAQVSVYNMLNKLSNASLGAWIGIKSL